MSMHRRQQMLHLIRQINLRFLNRIVHTNLRQPISINKSNCPTQLKEITTCSPLPTLQSKTLTRSAPCTSFLIKSSTWGTKRARISSSSVKSTSSSLSVRKRKPCTSREKSSSFPRASCIVSSGPGWKTRLLLRWSGDGGENLEGLFGEVELLPG